MDTPAASTSPPRRRRGLVAAGVVASVLAVAAALAVLVAPSREPGPATEKTTAPLAAFESCVPPATDPIDADCVAAALVTSSRSAGPEATFDALGAVVDEHPEVDWMCHGAAHEAGSAEFTERGDVVAAMASADASCGLGFLHGVLDAFGLSEPGLDGYAQVGRACQDTDVTDDASSCFHGVGHAVWNGSGDVAASAGACAALPSKMAESSCVAGVLMQMYAPANQAPAFPLADAPADLPALCAAWPAPGDSAAFCAEGAAYVLALPVANETFTRGDDATDSYDHYHDKVAGLGSICETFGPDLAASCSTSLARHLTGPISGHDVAVAASLCDALDEHAQSCRAAIEESTGAPGRS